MDPAIDKVIAESLKMAKADKLQSKYRKNDMEARMMLVPNMRAGSLAEKSMMEMVSSRAPTLPSHNWE